MPNIGQLSNFISNYIAGRAGLKPRTILSLKQTQARLNDFFDASPRLDSITIGDADEYREWLLGKYAPATVGRDIRKCRQFFTAAVRKQIISSNPFAEVKAPAQVNRERQHFISTEDTEKLIQACPDGQWRLIVALSRYGGLRCPSEHLALTWDCVDWQAQRIRVDRIR